MKKTLLTLCIGILTCAMLSISVMAAPYVAYWSFDENAVEMINGYTPSNPDAFKAVDGKNDKAFSGALEDQSGIIVYDDVNIPFVNSFTCAVWAKGDYNIESGSYYVMMAKNEKATDGHFEFYWNPSGSFSVYSTNSDMVSLLDSTNPMDDGQWHHYVIRVAENEWELYVDGSLDVTYSALEPLNIAAGPMFFGSLVNNTLPCQSALDDLLFLDYAIDPAEIASIMNDTKAYAMNAAGISTVAADDSAAAAPQEQPAAAPAAVVSTPVTQSVVTAPQTADTAVIFTVITMIALLSAIVIIKKSPLKY